MSDTWFPHTGRVMFRINDDKKLVSGTFPDLRVDAKSSLEIIKQNLDSSNTKTVAYYNNNMSSSVRTFFEQFSATTDATLINSEEIDNKSIDVLIVMWPDPNDPDTLQKIMNVHATLIVILHANRGVAADPTVMTFLYDHDEQKALGYTTISKETCAITSHWVAQVMKQEIVVTLQVLERCDPVAKPKVELMPLHILWAEYEAELAKCEAEDDASEKSQES